MIMKSFKPLYTTLLLAISLLMMACEEKIELKVPDHQLSILVVDGMITSDTTTHHVFLSLTGSFYMDEITPRVSGAQVSISDNLGNVFPLTEGSPGIYQTQPDVYGQVGVTYTLHIVHEGKTYQATSTMKRNAPIDSLSQRWDPMLEYYRILLYGQEPAGKGDCYMWHLYRNGIRVTYNIAKVMVTDDNFIDGNYINGFEVDWWANDFNFQSGDTITVAQHSLTREAYDFILAVFTEHNGGMGGMRPPANLPSNISNGAKGLFHASAVNYATRVLD